MKKNLFMLAAVAMAAAVSCNKELPQEQLPAGEAKVYSAIADGGNAKAVLDGKSTDWEDGDAILLYDGASAAKYVTSLEAPADKADFTLAEGETALAGNKVIAVYPEWADGYKSSVADIDGKTLSKAYLKSGQTARAGSYDPDAAIAMAYSEDNHLEFKNATALLKFTVANENVKTVTLYSIGGEKITGEWALEYNEGEPKATPAEGEASLSWVELSAGDGTFEVGKEYFISVFPQQLDSGFGVEFGFEGAEGKYLVKKYESSVEFRRNVILNLKELEFTGEIEPVAEWALAGSFNEWNPTADPMTLEDGFYVARNITKLNFTAQPDENDKSSATGFKFINKGDVWKGGKGAVKENVWDWVWNDNGNNIYVEGAAAETAYDVYLNPTPDADGGIKFVVVPAGSPMPEDKPAGEEEVVVDYWAVIGSMTDNWASEKEMTLDGDWYVVEDVEILDTDQFKFRANGDDNWTINRGAEGTEDGVIIADNVETTVVQGGKNFAVAADGVYSLYINKYANKAKVVRTGDIIIEEPGTTTPGEDSEWAVYAQFGSETWSEVMMKTTAREGLFVVENKTMKAYNRLLIKKYNDSAWKVKYGSYDVNYIKADRYFAVASNGGDIYVEAAGTYDIYFDYTNTMVYLMSAGTDYTSATEQIENGDAPVVETGTWLYLKPNSNWLQANARFAVYTWDGGDQWFDMKDSDSDGIYEVLIPEGISNIIFCRMNPGASANNWNNKWNQSSDLKVPTDGKNLYTVKANTWDKGGGTWSVK